MGKWVSLLEDRENQEVREPQNDSEVWVVRKNGL